ncbi:NmrA family NAD(P)-binding protein [Mucilaginibacter sp. KACC 22063]|uniref:NmrA family NAD(P)-binding protein n=1 Tax=Mucilaginibacter sp. KACC 22063 TaxID=3025666 RepID=UPI002366F8C7|nr:NmrA family NAD(P)-binding protein [Mucilaginibacter sp. KACC 22063]WDF56719.1 NmrA family NAD(P)-binding protein [Mucilaginibacter sp. KACC 22063]
MNNIILVAGATGELGGKICKALINRHAKVRAIVRAASDEGKVSALRNNGIEVIEADYADHEALIAACKGVSCVVSALAGLRDVIIAAQSQLLKAAVAAGVPRFIPSDFCTDYTQLLKGDNRNFDLRKEFQATIDSSNIKATSIFNGAFAYVLQYNIPLLNLKDKSIAYYEDKLDWKIDFTTLDDTAAYTAAAALDDNTPRYLRIAGFQVSPNELSVITKALYGEQFQLQQQGTMEQFAIYIKKARQEQPEGESELYPNWQQMQYLYSMFAAHHKGLDNGRYPELTWHNIQSALPQLPNQ